LFQADDQLVAVMVRGDCDVNEVKLKNFLGCKHLRLASAEVIKDLTGAEVGYAGPIELPAQIRRVGDHGVAGRVNFECGANRTHHHHIDVNFERDLPQPELADLKLAKAGDGCPKCEGRLQAARGIEVGHIFKLGAKYSEAMKCTYTDAEGKARPVVMGCYGIGVTRMAAAWIEQNHDEKGIIWNPQIAPFQVHLLLLNPEDASVSAAAENAYNELRAEGIDVLLDDRPLRPGEKFGDSDLIGLPIRLTVSKRTVEQNKIEVKLRREPKAEVVGWAEAKAKIHHLCRPATVQGAA
jgi:prolyl-tRNA synthetase